MIMRLFSAMLAAFFTVNVQAAFTFTPKENNKVGLYLGGQIWQSEASGFFGEKDTLIDFNLKKEQQTNYFIAVVHPFPLLPNVRISSTILETTGKTKLTQELSFGDETFSIDDDINASFNVNYIDYTLYYGLFHNDLFSFDLGLTARDFNGDVTITGSTITIDNEDDCPETPQSNVCPSPSGTYTPTGKRKSDELVAMLYFSTNATLPIAGLSAFAQGNFLSINDHSISDYQVGLSYDLVENMMMDFNLTLGYRAVKIAFEDLKDLYTDLEFKGAFLGVITHF